MRLHNIDPPATKEGPPPISYISYRGLGWLFVFAVYGFLLLWGFMYFPKFFYRLGTITSIISTWEVLGIVTYLRWDLPLGPSGALYTLYELLFPWSYEIPESFHEKNERPKDPVD